MRLSCKFEELDDKTRGYLQDVASRRGRGTPGVYIHGGNPWPALAIIFGPILAVILLVISFGSTKDPWAVAMLQTAAVLFGGWTIWYSLRRWAASRSKKYGGYFAYFDPLHAYEVNGEAITVTDLSSVRRVEAVSGGTVAFDLGHDRRAAVRLKSGRAAKSVEDYYAAMDDLENREDSLWAESDLAELGAAARFTAEQDQFPRNVKELDLELDLIPETPERVGRAGPGLLGLVLILLAGAGAFALFYTANAALADDIAFSRAKDGGAPGLRGYLLDERNQGHRDEARQLLSSLYDAPAAKLRGTPAEKPELREGMARLVESLRCTEAPVVSINVVEEGDLDTPEERTARVLRLRTDTADGLARGVGPELIAFASPAEGKGSHLTIKYHFVKITQAEIVPGQPAPADGAEVTIELRLEPHGQPLATGQFTVPVAQPGNTFSVDQIKVGICQVLVGEYKPAPVSTGGGDF